MSSNLKNQSLINLVVKGEKDTFVVFDSNCKLVKIVSSKEFGYIMDFEKWLKRNNYHANYSESFKNRDEKWLSMNLDEQLKSIGWRFENNTIYHTNPIAHYGN